MENRVMKVSLAPRHITFLRLFAVTPRGRISIRAALIFPLGPRNREAIIMLIFRVTSDSYEINVNTRECLLNSLSLHCPPGARGAWGVSLSQ